MDITGTADNGYHLVKTVMQRVELFDDITVNFEERQQNTFDIILTANKPYLPTDKKNIAYKAALLIAEKTSKKGLVTIDIKKRIPVAAGLAGGSGNGAAVLIALNRLLGINMSVKELCELGKNLGADVPFMILTQSTNCTVALGENFGDELTPLKYGLNKYIVLVKPPFGVSTKDVYKGMDDIKINLHPNQDALIDALYSKDFNGIRKNMINVLELYTLNKYSEVKELKKRMSQTEDAEFTLMSGSGPTVFSVYSTLNAAKSACLKFRELGYESYWSQAL